MLCFVMLCYVLFCYVMLCYVFLLCYVMFCFFVLLCYVMLGYVCFVCCNRGLLHFDGLFRTVTDNHIELSSGCVYVCVSLCEPCIYKLS